MTLELLLKAIHDAQKENPKGWKYMEVKIIDQKFGAHSASTAWTSGKNLLIK